MKEKMIRYTTPILIWNFATLVEEAYFSLLKQHPSSMDYWTLFRILNLGVPAIICAVYLYKVRGKKIFTFQFRPLYLLYSLAIVGVLLAYTRLAYGYFPRESKIVFTSGNWAIYPVLSVVKISIMNPLMEEVFFRGVLMDSYFKNSKYYLDVLLSTLLFVYSHFLGPHFFNLKLFIVYISAGTLFGLLYRRTGTIWYSLIAHILYNSIVNRAGWAIILGL